ncbi:hypothetical protein ACF8R4_10430 [Pseudomonas sp. FYR_2]|uniref:Uncharacterized protein n=1 Tax=Pseudomonas monteilii TaxID=76759 RepID=A0A7W2LAF1_9PSED|nr:MULTISPECIES: hypothetical protein [Pseudomonas]MBA6137319.1 hypothetical protein [Pseudomonas monteilii]MCA4075179.1 hypothetical protein [Pseudomonas kurunegalensis]MDT3745856.1 hypothetical protein [Pseudomonas kurunegalensis]MVF50863.1 hypothetical protein [Pseudomonas monteilii]
MTIALNGLGWQAAVHQQQRTSGVDPAAGDMLQFHLPVVASNATAQQGSENTSQQDAEDAREEAFAKLKLQLQNPGTSIGPSADASTEVTSSARQAFHDFMSKSPAEMIKEKLLRELGLTEDDYNALPPEKKELVDQQIAQRMKDDVEAKTQAKVDALATGNEEEALTTSQV